MQLSRLHGRKINDRVLRRGNVWKGKNMMVRWLPGPPKHPLVDPIDSALYIGTFASKNLSKSAVKRNRMRRRCREAWRVIAKNEDNLPTLQLLVSPRSSSLSCAFEDIQDDVRAFLSMCRSCPKARNQTS